MTAPTNVSKLPVLLPRPHPHQPIRAIDPDAFADLHLAHITSDVPDSVLFPFLHGLEGDNFQQNSFFAASSGLDLSRLSHSGRSGTECGGASGSGSRGPSPVAKKSNLQNVVKVPEYRGLVWVACEDADERSQGSDAELADQLTEDDEDEDFDLDYDEYDERESEEDEDEVEEHEQLMQVDGEIGVVGAEEASPASAGGDVDASESNAHMHPQTLRKLKHTKPIDIHHAHPHHSSFFSSSSLSTQQHAIRFPTSEPSSASLDNQHSNSAPAPDQDASAPHDRRLSTSTSSDTSEFSASCTSESESGHSQFGFGSTSASYSTTASSVGQLKDLEHPIATDSNSDADTTSPSIYTPSETDSTLLTTPNTSPVTDIAIDDCIPSLDTTTAPRPPVHTEGYTNTSPATPVPGTEKSNASSSPNVSESGSRLNGDEEGKRLRIASSFRACDLLTTDPLDGGSIFIPPKVPDGISLRNFGIQVPIYATLSDIVVYRTSNSPASTRAAFQLAEKFKHAIERKAAERKHKYEAAGVEVVWVRHGGMGEVNLEETNYPVRVYSPNLSTTRRLSSSSSDDAMEVEGNRPASRSRLDSERPKAYLVAYNVFVLTEPVSVLAKKAPWLVNRMPSAAEINARLTQGVSSAPIAPTNADGSSNEHPMALDEPSGSSLEVLPEIDFAQRERDEMRELTKATEILGGCVFLGNVNDVPQSTSVPDENMVAEHTKVGSGEQLDAEYAKEGLYDFFETDNPMGYDVCIECRDGASSVSTDQLRNAEEHLASLDAIWSARCFSTPGTPNYRKPRPPPSAQHIVHLAFPSSPYSFFMPGLVMFLEFLSALLSPRQHPPSTRPKKVLIYSSDGYTESSVLALCVLMKELGIDLPEAYLELQVEKGRSFFVYQSDLGFLKRVEQHLQRERASLASSPRYRSVRPTASRNNSSQHPDWTITQSPPRETGTAHPYARSPRNSISCPTAPSSHMHSPDRDAGAPPLVVPSQVKGEFSLPAVARRPRAQTSPFLPSHVSHQTWFNNPRFDGSFPSRVLPFLYLGNLGHAENAYMLHALGITHVVSVGECALIPPINWDDSEEPSHGRRVGKDGSLWTEEREGRIKVLDIQGVCDDGIDSLQHQLAPVCEWMEKARIEGGKILVHCRVGVSRSATVTIAYVMKHLNIPLVDAYLIVRSRRLNVLIQPNMRLLYNLCGWEVELVRERSGGDVRKLREGLRRSLNWPFLAREVHRLNEKYLH